MSDSMTGSNSSVDVSRATLILKLRVADEMAKEIDRLVSINRMDSRSKLADIRLNYGQPYKYEFGG